MQKKQSYHRISFICFITDIISYLKIYKVHCLSNFDLGNATKPFCILQY